MKLPWDSATRARYLGTVDAVVDTVVEQTLRDRYLKGGDMCLLCCYQSE